MRNLQAPAEVNIHLRARVHDRQIIDQAAELLGANRSQFMLSAALKKARQIIANQNTVELDNQSFCQLLKSLEEPATEAQNAGMQRLKDIESPWADE